MSRLNALQLAHLILADPELPADKVGLFLTSEKTVQDVTLAQYPYSDTEVMCVIRLADGRTDWFLFPRKMLVRTLQLLVCCEVNLINELS